MRSRVFQLSAHIIIHMKTVGTIWLALSIYQYINGKYIFFNVEQSSSRETSLI